MKEDLEYFELNNKVLEDFDNLMKMHLDKVKYLKINKNNEIIKKIDLSSNIESYTFNIEDENGYNVVHVDNNGISIIEASCKDKVCIKAGHIHNSLMPITCLPNKLMIKIENAKKEEVDATVY